MITLTAILQSFHSPGYATNHLPRDRSIPMRKTFDLRIVDRISNFHNAVAYRLSCRQFPGSRHSMVGRSGRVATFQPESRIPPGSKCDMSKPYSPNVTRPSRSAIKEIDAKSKLQACDLFDLLNCQADTVDFLIPSRIASTRSIR